MREIKFRAYAQVGKSWIYWDVYGEYPQGIYGSLSEPQQYTGLKDRNGVEIYEGDLIRNIKWDGQYEVKYRELRVWPDEAVGIGFEFPSVQDTGDDIEVVGNIFEGVKE